MAVGFSRFRSNGALLSPVRRLVRGEHWLFALLVASSVAVGLGQATVLAIMVQIGLHLAQSTMADTASLGILDWLPDRPGALIATGATAIAIVSALEAGNAYLQARIGARVLHRVRTRLYEAFADASVEAQTSLRSGELAQLLTVNGAWAGTATLSAARATVSFGNFAALAATAAALSLGTTLGMTAAVAVVLFAVRPIAGRGRGASVDMADRNTDLAESTGLAVELAQEIRTLGVEHRYNETIQSNIGDLSSYWGRVRFLTQLGPAMFRNAALIVVFAAISMIYFIDISSLPALGATMLMLIRAITYMQGFQGALQDLHSNVPWLDEMWAATENLERQRIDRSGEGLERFGPLTLAGASLTYPDGTPGLRHVDLRIEPGEIVGVVGPSGAGKSSLAQLLLRLRLPTGGDVCVDGRPLSSIALDVWTQRVAFVPQEPRLLPVSAAENISFFRDIDQERIERAARSAQIHDEICALPDGYDTVLETGDTRLSGGQRQRVALARAIAIEPDLLVLDEPTSALDLSSESLVAEWIAALRGRATVVVIAHRLSSLTACDRLIVIEDGMITGDGSHEQLLETSAFYRDAVRLSGARAG